MVRNSDGLLQRFAHRNDEGGSERWARRDQVERAYPQFRDFLQEKNNHDPEHRFQSDWWRHHRKLFDLP